MNWDNHLVIKPKWNGEIINKEKKLELAKKVAAMVKEGQVIGFGSGSTSFLAIGEIAKRMEDENLHITAIPTSKEVEMLCHYLSIPTTNLLEQKPDWNFDGADEVDEKKNLIKGRGAAMFQEKLVMSCSKERYILIDESKRVKVLGEKFAVPIEIYSNSMNFVKQELLKLGAKEVTLRLAKMKDGPVITENGNVILDTKFDIIEEDLEKKIKEITGVIESGLFIGYDVTVIS